LVSLPPAIQATGRLALAPAGLAPAEHACLLWTHTEPHAVRRLLAAYVLTGMLNKQIAFELGVSEKTVKVHRARVMEKMRAGSVIELVQLG